MKLVRSLSAAANKDTVFLPQKKHQLLLLPDVLFGGLSQQGAKWWRMNAGFKWRPQAPSGSRGDSRREVLYRCCLLGLGVDVSSYLCCLSPKSTRDTCVNVLMFSKLPLLFPHRSPGVLLAAFTEGSVGMKAMHSFTSAPLQPWAAKVLSSFHFIYSNSTK